MLVLDEYVWPYNSKGLNPYSAKANKEWTIPPISPEIVFVYCCEGASAGKLKRIQG